MDTYSNRVLTVLLDRKIKEDKTNKRTEYIYEFGFFLLILCSFFSRDRQRERERGIEEKNAGEIKKDHRVDLPIPTQYRTIDTYSYL